MLCKFRYESSVLIRLNHRYINNYEHRHRVARALTRMYKTLERIDSLMERLLFIFDEEEKNNERKNRGDTHTYTHMASNYYYRLFFHSIEPCNCTYVCICEWADFLTRSLGSAQNEMSIFFRQMFGDLNKLKMLQKKLRKNVIPKTG